MATTNGFDAGAARRFRIIVHTSPPTDRSCLYWTEAPECPTANEDGDTVDEAVARTETVIQTRWALEMGAAAGAALIEVITVDEAE